MHEGRKNTWERVWESKKERERTRDRKDETI